MGDEAADAMARERGQQAEQGIAIEQLLMRVAARPHLRFAPFEHRHVGVVLGHAHLGRASKAAVAADQVGQLVPESMAAMESGISAKSRPSWRTPPALRPEACWPTPVLLDHDGAEAAPARKKAARSHGCHRR